MTLEDMMTLRSTYVYIYVYMASLDFACTFWCVNWLLCWYGKLLCQGLGELNGKLLDYQSAVSCEHFHLVRGGFLLSLHVLMMFPSFPPFRGGFLSHLSPISSPYVPHLFIAFSHRFPRCSQISYLFPRCFLDGSKLKTWGTTDFRFSWVSTIQLFGVPNDLIHSHVPMFISPKNFPNCPFLQGGAPPSYKLVYHLH